MSNSSIVNFTSTLGPIVTYEPSVFPSIKYCLKNHNQTFCNYVSFLIFMGYVIRLFVLPFIIIRIYRLKFDHDYNFSLIWLWSISSYIFLDIIEYICAFNTQLYTKTISVINLAYFISSIALILIHLYYHCLKLNLIQFFISIFFLLLWILVAILRATSINITQFYIAIYFVFASAQVSSIFFFLFTPYECILCLFDEEKPFLSA
jgi:hypothetical protein